MISKFFIRIAAKVGKLGTNVSGFHLAGRQVIFSHNPSKNGVSKIHLKQQMSGQSKKKNGYLERISINNLIKQLCQRLANELHKTTADRRITSQ
jgi:hypothetical protein